MTVPVPGSLTYAYVADGVTTVFPYPVRFLEADELLVRQEAPDGALTELGYNVDYTVTGAGNPSGGSITTLFVPADGRIIISRRTTAKQLVDLHDNARNPAEAVEQQLDRMVMTDQDLGARIGDVEGKTAAIDDAVRLTGEYKDAALTARDEAVQAASDADVSATTATNEADRAEAAAVVVSGAMTTLLDPQFATKTTAEAYVPPVGSPPDYIRTAGYAEAGDWGGASYVPTEDPDGDLSISDGVSTFNYVLRHEYVTPQMCGAIAGATSPQDAAGLNACKNAIEDDVPLMIHGEFTFDVVDVPSVAAGGRLRIRNYGKVNHVDGSSGDMFASGPREQMTVFGPGIFDGNKDNQTVDRRIFALAGVKHFHAFGPTFQNIKNGAIHQVDPVNSETFIVDRVTCQDGGLHQGVLNGPFCEFILVRNSRLAHIRRSRFAHSVDPLPGQNRNPAGISFRHTGTDPTNSKVIVEYCWFENLGFSSEGNHIAPLDFYSAVDTIDLHHLWFRKSRCWTLRTNYARVIKVSDMDIYQDVPMYTNDTTEHGLIMSIGMTDRGYTNDSRDVDIVEVSRNFVLCEGGRPNTAIGYGNSDNDYLMRKVVSEKNIMLVQNGNSTAPAINVSRVLDFVSRDDTADGFLGGIRIGATSTGNTMPAKRAKALVEQLKVSNTAAAAGYGVFARTDVGNLDLTIDDMTCENVPVNSFTIRDAGAVVVKNSDLGGQAGDAQGNDSFKFIDNRPGTVDRPQGYTANDSFEFRGNKDQDYETSFVIEFNGTANPVVALSDIIGHRIVGAASSTANGVQVALTAANNANAKFDVKFEVLSASGISTGGSTLGHFYPRSMSTSALEIGLKTTPTAGHTAASAVASGRLRVTLKIW